MTAWTRLVYCDAYIHPRTEYFCCCSAVYTTSCVVHTAGMAVCSRYGSSTTGADGGTYKHMHATIIRLWLGLICMHCNKAVAAGQAPARLEGVEAWLSS